MKFYDNYETALQSGEFTGDRIYNLDETGVTTVVQAPKVVGQFGARQVGQAVSAERGTMIDHSLYDSKCSWQCCTASFCVPQSTIA